MLALSALAFAPPPATNKAGTARWMVSNINWGALSTTSSRKDGTTIGDAFGNPYSFADVGGVPYMYASDLDASMQDNATHSQASLALSEAAVTTSDGAAAFSACDIANVSALGDPENPPCARLVLSGKMVRVVAKSDEETAAKAALFARHPSFKHYPSGHGFFVAKLALDGLWLIDFYGGAAIIKPADYFAASPSAPAAARLLPGAKAPASAVAVAVGSKPPPTSEHPETARWMASNLEYGFLSTTSTRSDGTTVGQAFGNPYSFADVGGVPYIYASLLDASMVDTLGTEGASPRASLALSEAALPGKPLSSCHIGSFPFGDPENPPCARLVLSGSVVKVTNATEVAAAKAALFARHPSFKDYPSGHDFFVGKLDVDGLWLIDMFGGAAIIKPADYFAAK